MPSTIAICIEVASPDRLGRWLDDGWMPHLAALRDRGVFGPLESITEVSSGSIWPSFATGTHPGKHGQFFTHMQIEPGTYRIDKKYADDIPRDSFWMELDRSGRSSTIVDVAQSRPIPSARGSPPARSAAPTIASRPEIRFPSRPRAHP